MSEDYIYIIPANPEVVFDDAKLESAVSFFRSIAPQADEIGFSVSDRLEFVHCGGNFQKICCPSCGAKIEVDLWQEWMDQDYSDKGFILVKRPMQCCGAPHTLPDLAYDWPQGFACCQVCAMNPNLGVLFQEQSARFATILECPIRVIYQHL